MNIQKKNEKQVRPIVFQRYSAFCYAKKKPKIHQLYSKVESLYKTILRMYLDKTFITELILGRMLIQNCPT